MIYSVNFMELAENINPLAFSKYLKDTGWAIFPSKKTYIRIFQCEKNNEFYQVIIPLEKKLADYKEAMYKAITSVANAEKNQWSR